MPPRQLDRVGTRACHEHDLLYHFKAEPLVDAFGRILVHDQQLQALGGVEFMRSKGGERGTDPSPTVGRMHRDLMDDAEGRVHAFPHRVAGYVLARNRQSQAVRLPKRPSRFDGVDFLVGPSRAVGRQQRLEAAFVEGGESVRRRERRVWWCVGTELHRALRGIRREGTPRQQRFGLAANNCRGTQRRIRRTRADRPVDERPERLVVKRGRAEKANCGRHRYTVREPRDLSAGIDEDRLRIVASEYRGQLNRREPAETAAPRSGVFG